jgi:hypothetical protein
LTIGKQISFAEYLYNGSSLSGSDVEKVTLRYQDELHEVDKDKFFQIAEEIMVTGAKNEMLYETKTDSKTPEPYRTVLYVELLDADDNCVYYGAVSRYGEVDRYGLFMSRLMEKDYEMKTEDLSKLYSLFPDYVQKDMPVDDMDVDRYIEVFQNHFSQRVDESSKKYAFVITAVILVAFVAWFVVRKKTGKN